MDREVDRGTEKVEMGGGEERGPKAPTSRLRKRESRRRRLRPTYRRRAKLLSFDRRTIPSPRIAAQSRKEESRQRQSCRVSSAATSSRAFRDLTVGRLPGPSCICRDAPAER